MIDILKKFNSFDLLKGNFGIEREMLRVDRDGELSKKPHPKAFGDKLNNPYITTDFSESQIEVITPPMPTVKETHNFLSTLYDITALECKDEYLWPQSMPCIVPDDKDIPLAEFNDTEKGIESRKYREKLIKKYGGKRQLISGIHFNFSFNEEIIEELFKSQDNCKDYKEFKNNIYLKTTRNYLRYRWLIVYLLGAASVVHDSFYNQCTKSTIGNDKCKFSNRKALSFRNGECGYKNDVDLFPNYNSLPEYIKSINDLIESKVIDSPKELYSSIRLKAKETLNVLKSLEEGGINYLEFRSIDLNPYEKSGVALKDLEFLQLFNLYCLVKEEKSYDLWQEEALENQHRIAKDGLKDISLINNGVEVDKKSWAYEILDEIKNLCVELDIAYEDILKYQLNKVEDSSKTYASMILEDVNRRGFINVNLELAKKYKEESYKNRFKFIGYEDLELSTQILIKESVKHGIKIELIDRADNFISLEKDNKVEYVKQATKTSKDNYVTVLMMENKTVTKKVVGKHDIRVPLGDEFNSIEEAERNVDKFVNKPIVIKPKSTNFGKGISIFKDGGSREELVEGFKIAFKDDSTVLIEEFIKGKEYRFLVIDDEVVGILHRVPANVTGDGKLSIRELVEIKNQDPLRGKGYVTPLEKIKLDDAAKLFLKNDNKDFDYVPAKDEVVYLRENSNISTGGDSIDYTDLIPQKFKDIAVKCAKAVNARICGVDIMLEDYSSEDSEYGIIELNFNPAIHIHCFPYKGTERNIAYKVLKLLELV
mgnify:CR=1 FL=1